MCVPSSVDLMFRTVTSPNLTTFLSALNPQPLMRRSSTSPGSALAAGGSTSNSAGCGAGAFGVEPDHARARREAQATRAIHLREHDRHLRQRAGSRAGERET